MHTVLNPDKYRAAWLVLVNAHGRLSWHRFALSQAIRELKVDDTLQVPIKYFEPVSVRSRVALVAKEWDGRRKFMCKGADDGVQVKRVR